MGFNFFNFSYEYVKEIFEKYQYESLEIANEINVIIEDRHKKKTLLHYAARTNLLPIAENLLLKGANVNAIDENDNTPLHEVTKAKS